MFKLHDNHKNIVEEYIQKGNEKGILTLHYKNLVNTKEDRNAGNGRAKKL